MTTSDYRDLFIAITSGLVASTIQAFLLDKYLRQPNVKNLIRTVLIVFAVIMLFFVFLTAMVWSDKHESRIYVVSDSQYKEMLAKGRIEGADEVTTASSLVGQSIPTTGKKSNQPSS